MVINGVDQLCIPLNTVTRFLPPTKHTFALCPSDQQIPPGFPLKLAPYQHNSTDRFNSTIYRLSTLSSHPISDFLANSTHKSLSDYPEIASLK